MPSVWTVFLSQGKKQEEALVPALENLKFIEEQLKGKKFFGGEKIGLLDLAIGWMADMVSVLEEVTGLKLIQEDKFPLLSAWIEIFADVLEVKESGAPREKLISKFRAIRDAYAATK